MGAVQLAGQGLQLGLGDERVGVVVAAAHALGHGGGDRVGQPVGDIAQLVQLTALDRGMVEDVGDGTAQGFGPVDHNQDGTSHLQAALTQPGQQVGDHAGVLAGALGQAEGDFGAVHGDAERDHAAVLGDLDAVDQQRHQVQPGQVSGE